MTGIYVAFHRWRGFSHGNTEPDLFHHVWVMGWATVYVCKACLIGAYRKLKATVRDAVNKTEAR